MRPLEGMNVDIPGSCTLGDRLYHTPQAATFGFYHFGQVVSVSTSHLCSRNGKREKVLGE